MPNFVTRPADLEVVADFLAGAAAEPACLLFEGEAGIGKTTLWAAAAELARDKGFQVLSARAAQAESVLAYTSVADLFGGIDRAVFAELPVPQRRAVDRVLLRGDTDARPTDQRAVAAGFLSVVNHIAAQAPVLLAIDDLQWLDASSRHVIAFAARRLRGPVGILGAVRTEVNRTGDDSWLEMPRPDMKRRIEVPPLSLGALHEVIVARLGRSISRPALVKIHEISRGNPFYALELARSDVAGPLPGTLAELVGERIGGLADTAQEALLAAACVATPTVELVAHAVGNDIEKVVELMTEAEEKGIVAIDGNRLRFSHPLLAAGVYGGAAPARRRAIHRRLADIIDQPELHARHLALAVTGGDADTIQALDDGAESARVRGAPAAAAELLEMAVRLGGDTPDRRIRLARDLVNAGDPKQAWALLDELIGALEPGPLRAHALHLLAKIVLADENYPEAVDALARTLADAGDDVHLRAQALAELSYAQLFVGLVGEALATADEAITLAEPLGETHLLSEALTGRVMIGFLSGDGVDEQSLYRAMELEDPDSDCPAFFRATVQHACLLGGTGRLDLARRAGKDVCRHYAQQGREPDVAVMTFHVAMVEFWRGDLAAATALTEEATEKARQLNRDFPVLVAATLRGTLATYAGDEAQARADFAEAMAAAHRWGLQRTAAWLFAALGFLEVSLGDYQGTIDALEPALAMLELPVPLEMFFGSFVPDAAEALVHVGRLDEAEALIDRLERDGRRLDRAWMLATGARCRALLLAARGDVVAALEAADRSMKEHERLPMPFEKARSQLVLGQLQCRHRKRGAAAATLRAALETFESLGTPLWAERARVELARLDERSEALTASELRVAELAAAGLTNRDVAAALYISPKTVEANLARVYRKLRIGSRAELGQRMTGSERVGNHPTAQS